MTGRATVLAPREGQFGAEGYHVNRQRAVSGIKMADPSPPYVTYVMIFVSCDKCHPFSCSLQMYVAYLGPRERVLEGVDGDHLAFQRRITLFHERRVETESSSGVSGGPRGDNRKSQGVLS